MRPYRTPDAAAAAEAAAERSLVERAVEDAAVMRRRERRRELRNGALVLIAALAGLGVFAYINFVALLVLVGIAVPVGVIYVLAGRS